MSFAKPSGKELLEMIKKLPDLLAIAIEAEEHGEIDGRYEYQDQLRLKYQESHTAYFYSMPVRHLYHCKVCGLQKGEIHHEIEFWSPSGESSRIYIKASELHALAEHQIQ